MKKEKTNKQTAKEDNKARQEFSKDILANVKKALKNERVLIMIRAPSKEAGKSVRTFAITGFSSAEVIGILEKTKLDFNEDQKSDAMKEGLKDMLSMLDKK